MVIFQIWEVGWVGSLFLCETRDICGKAVVECISNSMECVPFYFSKVVSAPLSMTSDDISKMTQQACPLVPELHTRQLSSPRLTPTEAPLGLNQPILGLCQLDSQLHILLLYYLNRPSCSCQIKLQLVNVISPGVHAAVQDRK